MKKQSNTLFTMLRKHTLVDLTKEVKETLAINFSIKCQRPFTAADLWNIQRRGKNMVQHRFIF